MRWLHGRRHPEERDVELGRALEELDAPEYPPDFLATVWERVDAETGAASGAKGPAQGQTDAAAPTPPVPARRPWFRRPVVAAATAVAAVAIVVAVVVLAGVPGVSDVGGPEPVSAAQVLEKTLRAMSSGRTLVMDITERSLDGIPYGGEPEYKVTHMRYIMRSDGSFRFAQTDVAPAGVATGGQRKGYLGALYDAPTGIRRDFITGWDDDTGSIRHELEVTTDAPLGPPDAWPSMETGLSSTTLALQAAGQTTLATTTYAGRPVWVISAVGVLALSDHSATTLVTIDRETCLPLRVQSEKDGWVTWEQVWRYVAKDEALPDGVFTRVPTKGMRVQTSSAGFLRLPLERIAAMPGYEVVLPVGGLPAGYRLLWTAAAASATTANDLVEGSNVVALAYARGFDGLTVTTRRVADPAGAASWDPVEAETSYARLVSRPVRLDRGAFAGVTAQLVVAPGIMMPHLYAVKDGVLLTVAGAVTAEELVAIARSLQPYPAPGASP